VTRIITISINGKTLTIETEERTHPLRSVMEKYISVKKGQDVFLQGFILDLNIEQIINKLADHLIRTLT